MPEHRKTPRRRLGELLFAAVDALRQEGIDAEEALTFAAKRFAREAKHQSNG